jgi:cell division protein FtsL
MPADSNKFSSKTETLMFFIGGVMFAQGTEVKIDIGPNVVALAALFIPAVMLLVQGWIVYQNRRISSKVAENKALVADVAEQVKTMNSLTVGQMADATESRRIADIPKEDRTKEEDKHIALVPEPPTL